MQIINRLAMNARAGLALIVVACAVSLGTSRDVQAQAVVPGTLSGIEKSQNIRLLGVDGCLRGSIFGEEGPFPVPLTLAPCQNSTWHPYRWLFEQRSSGGARYFRIHPRSRADLCLGLKAGTETSARPIVQLQECQAQYLPISGGGIVEKAHQLWGVLPISTENDGPFVIFNVGSAGALAHIAPVGQPKVLTASLDSRDEVWLEHFHAGDGQVPRVSQLWSSQEIYCVLRDPNKHAYGTVSGGGVSTGGGGAFPFPTYTNCRE